jgi:hypothetical protein
VSRKYELGDKATGVVADENEWNRTGPRIIRPKRTAWGAVTGLFGASDTAVIIETNTGESLCIRVDMT